MTAARVAALREVDHDRAIKQLLVALFLVGSACYVLLGSPFVPERFLYDSKKIATIAGGYQGYDSDKSFSTVGTIYRELGLADQPMWAGLLGYLLFVAVLLVSLRDRLGNAGLLSLALLAGTTVLAVVYVGTYSKDVFVLPIALIALWRRRGIWPEVVLVGAMAYYAHEFRDYWYLVIGGYIGFRVVMARRFSVRRMIGAALAALVVLSVVFQNYLGVELDFYRTKVNEVRIGDVDTRTLIEPFFDLEGPVGSFLNSAIVLLTFAVPLPLIVRLSPYYLLVAAFLVVLWFMFARAVHLSSAESRTDPRWARLVALVLGLTVVQSVFEPDYGSYVRHLTPLLPLMLAVILWRSPASAAPAPETEAETPAEDAARTPVETSARTWVETR
ncbi:hypothetical protein [Promicromonospora iranensis]|uniref:Dolichyl-phosphate-mannose-protein mannosyltransferase n=1 Tax=Promicromonospora iranensis TaxID=1105144 RepID=A0ABU2CR43_9MICO|nr:hypothetical protein [Promicromonospora iranensis]MDR7383818.1 hypothetical protein [Promicromonospora iranensis]